MNWARFYLFTFSVAFEEAPCLASSSFMPEFKRLALLNAGSLSIGELVWLKSSSGLSDIWLLGSSVCSFLRSIKNIYKSSSDLRICP